MFQSGACHGTIRATGHYRDGETLYAKGQCAECGETKRWVVQSRYAEHEQEEACSQACRLPVSQTTEP